MDNRCVCCGEIIPEGRQVCPNCEKKAKERDAIDFCGELCAFAEDIINRAKQKWIPVTERLPEVVDTYLVVVVSKYDYEKEYSIDTDVATYNPHEDGYIDNCWNTYIDWDEGQQYLHVTHWMPLPTPPKGE